MESVDVITFEGVDEVVITDDVIVDASEEDVIVPDVIMDDEELSFRM